MHSSISIPSQLNKRRKQLRMSCAALAAQSGVSLRTVQRVLSGEEKKPGLATVVALAQGLGISLHLNRQSVATVRRRQAQRKARQLVAIVQGTSSLEAQAVKDATMVELRNRTMKDLLIGSPRRLWAR